MSRPLFEGEYQGGASVDVLTPQGANPLTQWKVSGAAKTAKAWDKDLKSNVFNAGGSGVKLTAPKDDKATLGLLQPFLVLQVCFNQVRVECMETTHACKTRQPAHAHARMPTTNFTARRSRRSRWSSSSPTRPTRGAGSCSRPHSPRSSSHHFTAR
jgi:hypothetical protein